MVTSPLLHVPNPLAIILLFYMPNLLPIVFKSFMSRLKALVDRSGTHNIERNTARRWQTTQNATTERKETLLAWEENWNALTVTGYWPNHALAAWATLSARCPRCAEIHVLRWRFPIQWNALRALIFIRCSMWRACSGFWDGVQTSILGFRRITQIHAYAWAHSNTTLVHCIAYIDIDARMSCCNGCCSLLGTARLWNGIHCSFLSRIWLLVLFVTELK